MRLCGWPDFSVPAKYSNKNMLAISLVCAVVTMTRNTRSRSPEYARSSMGQPSFTQAKYAGKRKQTLHEKFLSEMEGRSGDGRCGLLKRGQARGAPGP